MPKKMLFQNNSLKSLNKTAMTFLHVGQRIFVNLTIFIEQESQ